MLNIESRYDSSLLDSMEPRPVAEGLAELPTLDELCKAISAISNNKAPGQSGILPEMIKYAGTVFHESLLFLMHSAWRNGCVPQAWRDAELVPAPKKGDLSVWDNWRGIALLDVVGKVVGRLIQNRLQQFAEETLPETHCGFQQGRSCTDQIFTTMQLVEKLFEHRLSGFFIFVDLKKAYDCIPRAALWRCLELMGVPQPLVQLISSFYTGMSARV